MLQNNKFNQLQTEVPYDPIDYQYYEKRARCLRSGTLLKWLSGREARKNYSSIESLCE